MFENQASANNFYIIDIFLYIFFTLRQDLGIPEFADVIGGQMFAGWLHARAYVKYARKGKAYKKVGMLVGR